MKKKIYALTGITILAILVGCGNSSETTASRNNNGSAVEEVLAAGMEEYESEGDLYDPSAGLPGDDLSEDDETVSGAGEKPVSTASAEGVDVDLTALSSTMVYSEVYNMMMSPNDYIGKVVKMQGTYLYVYDSTTGSAITAVSSRMHWAAVPRVLSSCLRTIMYIRTIIPRKMRRSPSSASLIPIRRGFIPIAPSGMPCLWRNKPKRWKEGTSLQPHI